jgi:GNAT superfamily N-acetyltransferase
VNEQPLRRARERDLPEVVDIWVDAFTQDPYLRWIAPDDATWAGFGPAWLDWIATHCFARGHTYLHRSGNLAVAWIPPDLPFVSAADVGVGYGIIATHAGAARADDAFATIMEARGHSLTDSHWTLQYIGARARARGQGLGAAALSPMLAECDADDLPCGLVSTNPRNLSFYERHGFGVIAEVFTPDGAAAMRPMHRAAAASVRP